MAEIKTVIAQIMEWCTWSHTYNDMFQQALCDWLGKDGDGNG